jgi:hypothetical protein
MFRGLFLRLFSNNSAVFLGHLMAISLSDPRNIRQPFATLTRIPFRSGKLGPSLGHIGHVQISSPAGYRVTEVRIALRGTVTEGLRCHLFYGEVFDLGTKRSRSYVVVHDFKISRIYKEKLLIDHDRSMIHQWSNRHRYHEYMYIYMSYYICMYDRSANPADVFQWHRTPQRFFWGPLTPHKLDSPSGQLRTCRVTMILLCHLGWTGWFSTDWLYSSVFDISFDDDIVI